MRILVTGGAGFIGSHLVSHLVSLGHQVRVLDALVPQVHGSNPTWPARLPTGLELQLGNVTSVSAWKQALEDVEVVYHLAAEVGVGQSMYEIVRYMNANTMGTAILLELLASKKYPIQKLIVASSMSIYGEGAYVCGVHGTVAPPVRTIQQMEQREWELFCPICHQQLKPVATPEDKPLRPTSVYAISKRDQEELVLNVGMAYAIPSVALRFFNVYGPGQALSNPYTGVAAIFSSRLLNLKPPIIFEDGYQSRDFVYVSDIVQGLILALERDEANYQTINLGTGVQRTIKDLALALAQAMNLDIAPEIVNKYRAGDIRHCFADISRARELLGYSPRIPFSDGMSELVEWVKTQNAADRVAQAYTELEKYGLAR